MARKKQTSSKKLKKELEKTKKDLGDLERYIREFSDFLPLAVCTLSSAGIITNINSAFEKMTGFKPIEITGKPFEELFLEKKEAQRIIKKIGKKEIKERELILLTKNNDEIAANVYFGSRRNKKGILNGFFVGVTDIGELKKLQKGLEKKVRERTKELQEKIDEMKKFQRLTIDRELKMAELKEEIERLKKELENYGWKE